MTPEILLTFGVLAVAVVLFLTEWIRYDLVALGVVGVLMLTGLATVEQGLSGFSNEAVITIACLLILSQGLKRTGGLELVSDALARLNDRSPRATQPVMLAGTGVLSAFINNTAVVALLIPVTFKVARESDTPPSKLLIPLSFISIFGGMCTLVGTSTNLLVSSVMEDHGLEPLTMFELTPVGVLMLGVGFVWLLVLGPRMLPAREAAGSLPSRFDLASYLSDLRLGADFEGLGQAPDCVDALDAHNVEMVQVFRDGEARRRSEHELRLHEGDVVRVHGTPDDIAETLSSVPGLSPVAGADSPSSDLEVGEDVLCEAVIAHDAPIAGEPLGQVNLVERFDALPMAVRRRDELARHALSTHTLEPGDALLLKIRTDRVASLKQDRNFVVTSSLDVPSVRKGRLPVALSILVAVIGLAALTPLDIVATALGGVVLMVLAGCLTPEEATEAIDWKIIFLLAGLIPLGSVMEQTGAAAWLAEATLGQVRGAGLHAMVAATFGLTMLLTNLVSNAATAVLLAPLALNAAQSAGVDPRPLLITVTLGASLSFLTPIGYQTNTLVYSAGSYRFSDFLKFGTPLNLVTWILAVVLVPWWWG